MNSFSKNDDQFFYSGVFFSKEMREKIISIFKPKYKNVFAHHLTIKFPVSVDEIEKLSIGQKVNLKIIGMARDEKAEALVVETDLSDNQYPHVTLSTAEGIKPFYSNELIANKGYEKLDKPVRIEGIIGISRGKATFTNLRIPVSKIILPTRVQPDTLLAIFLLRKFGEVIFPKIAAASIELWSVIPKDETLKSLEEKGILLLDLGGGRFDHHGKQTQVTASDLVSEYLGIKDDAALSKLLEYARRDDFYGKGTVSTDNLDRAFGLSGLITSLNKNWPNLPNKIAAIVLPLYEAHYEEEKRRTTEMPLEVEEKLKEGKANVFAVKQRDKKLKIISIESNNISLPGFLRSKLGGGFDVVMQWLPSGHVNILTRPTKRVDLRSTVAVIRNSERMLKNDTSSHSDLRSLSRVGRIEGIPEWYFDDATNSLFNGGINPKDVPVTKISKEKLEKILTLGLSEELWSPLHRSK